MYIYLNIYTYIHLSIIYVYIYQLYIYIYMYIFFIYTNQVWQLICEYKKLPGQYQIVKNPWRLLESHATFCATVRSNRWQPIECRVEWMGVSDRFAPKFAANSCSKSYLNMYYYTPTDLQLSERLASLGISGAQLRAPLKPPIHHSTVALTTV